MSWHRPVRLSAARDEESTSYRSVHNMFVALLGLHDVSLSHLAFDS